MMIESDTSTISCPGVAFDELFCSEIFLENYVTNSGQRRNHESCGQIYLHLTGKIIFLR